MHSFLKGSLLGVLIAVLLRTYTDVQGVVLYEDKNFVVNLDVGPVSVNRDAQDRSAPCNSPGLGWFIPAQNGYCQTLQNCTTSGGVALPPGGSISCGGQNEICCTTPSKVTYPSPNSSDIPAFPSPPSFPNFTVPNLPPQPNYTVPAFPPTPNFTVPTFPPTPNFTVPTFPTAPNFTVPTLPTAPNFTVPSVPPAPTFPTAPNLTVPALPPAPPVPTAPNLTVPAVPPAPVVPNPNPGRSVVYDISRVPAYQTLYYDSAASRIRRQAQFPSWPAPPPAPPQPPTPNVTYPNPPPFPNPPTFPPGPNFTYPQPPPFPRV